MNINLFNSFNSVVNKINFFCKLFIINIRMEISTESQNSCFIFIVGVSTKEEALIYEHTCKWLLRIVNTKLAMTGFDIAKLVPYN